MKKLIIALLLAAVLVAATTGTLSLYNISTDIGSGELEASAAQTTPPPAPQPPDPPKVPSEPAESSPPLSDKLYLQPVQTMVDADVKTLARRFAEYGAGVAQSDRYSPGSYFTWTDGSILLSMSEHSNSYKKYSYARGFINSFGQDNFMPYPYPLTNISDLKIWYHWENYDRSGAVIVTAVYLKVISRLDPGSFMSPTVVRDALYFVGDGTIIYPSEMTSSAGRDYKSYTAYKGKDTGIFGGTVYD